MSFESVFYGVFYFSSKKQIFFCFLLYLHFLITVLKFYSSNSGPQQSSINSHALLKGIRLFTSDSLQQASKTALLSSNYPLSLLFILIYVQQMFCIRLE